MIQFDYDVNDLISYQNACVSYIFTVFLATPMLKLF